MSQSGPRRVQVAPVGIHHLDCADVSRKQHDRTSA